MIDLADRFAIYELIALYAHVIDSREYGRVNELFAADGIFDMSLNGHEPVEGPDAIRALMMDWHEKTSQSGEPLAIAHYGTNIVITPNDDGTCNVVSKGISFWTGEKVGRVAAGIYRDVVVKTADGWRFKRRAAGRLGTFELPRSTWATE